MTTNITVALFWIITTNITPSGWFSKQAIPGGKETHYESHSILSNQVMRVEFEGIKYDITVRVVPIKTEEKAYILKEQKVYQ